MPNRKAEEQHLIQARTHVAKAEACVATQCTIIARLGILGVSTDEAENSLSMMEDTLRVTKAHLQLLEDAAVKVRNVQ